MKATVTLFTGLLALNAIGQTITYTHFSAALTATAPVNIAANASFNATLTTLTGHGVTWDASGLVQQSGTPTIHLSFGSPSATPQGSLYPTSNYAEYDPALTSLVGYNYYQFTADSVVKTGTYDPNGAHEVYQNGDKALIFPFSYGQSFTDTYEKTNYSNATTVSSQQTGTRTVSFNGFGTLILPQGSFANVALISESRTNSLGPVSTYYTWYDISNGKKLLYRSENAGSLTTAWSGETATALHERSSAPAVSVFPNPFQATASVRIDARVLPGDLSFGLYNAMGEAVRLLPVRQPELVIDAESLESGIYFYRLWSGADVWSAGKLVIQ